MAINPKGLGGTVRTLDSVKGATELEADILSHNGFTVVDDSNSFTITEDGWVDPRKNNTTDLYFFGYGHNYRGALKDFYYLCGNTPLLPRYALGNWWSCYYRYTEQSYKELIEHFEHEKIPFSVAVVDMDCHLTDIDPKYGNGWTGYTWNPELFPDPPRFLRWLHNHSLTVTLNVHILPMESARMRKRTPPWHGLWALIVIQNSRRHLI
jgi:alpha-glucosidase (family GH31 glycosyl hydrolase)